MEFLLILVCWFGFQKYIDIMQIYRNCSVDRRGIVCVLYVHCSEFTRSILTRSSLQQQELSFLVNSGLF